MKNSSFFKELNNLTKEVLSQKDIAIISITGKAGTGKSTLGKYFRKKGFGEFSRYKISTIDDGVMSIDLFYIFNKRVKFKTTHIDELEPFLTLLPKRKQVIFYVNQAPELRISKADIVLCLSIDEDTRKMRLEKRDNRYSTQKETNISIEYTHLMKIDMCEYKNKIYLG